MAPVIFDASGDEIDVDASRKVLDLHGISMRIVRECVDTFYEDEISKLPTDITWSMRVEIYRVDSHHGGEQIVDMLHCTPHNQVKTMKSFIERVRVGIYDSQS